MAITFVKPTRAHMPSIIDLLDDQLSAFRPNEAHFDAIWRSFSSQPNLHARVALEDGRIIAYGVLVIETKIRGGKMGHIEDIVVHPARQKCGIGRQITQVLFEIARKHGCYKLALQCRENNVAFYECCNYQQSGVAMQTFSKEAA